MIHNHSFVYSHICSYSYKYMFNLTCVLNVLIFLYAREESKIYSVIDLSGFDGQLDNKEICVIH